MNTDEIEAKRAWILQLAQASEADGEFIDLIRRASTTFILSLVIQAVHDLIQVVLYPGSAKPISILMKAQDSFLKAYSEQIKWEKTSQN